MTALDARPASPRSPVTAASAGPSADATSTSASRRVATLSTIAALVLVVGWGMFLVLDGPGGNAWYHTRQRQLASELASAREHAGAGAAIAVLQIPATGTNVVIAEGDGPRQLRGGPGHRIGSPQPGEVGNSIIVGHRQAWGGPFESLSRLKKDDLIVVQRTDADGVPQNGVFTVVDVASVGAGDVQHLRPSNDRRVTLVTGRGGRFSDEQLVVTAVSGKVGQVRAGDPTTVAQTPDESAWRNGEFLFAIAMLGGALLLARVLRRRYHTGVVIAAVAPLIAVGLLAAFLDLDASLSSIR